MYTLFENLNLGLLNDDDELHMAFLHMAIENGIVINGYYNCPFINYHFGDAQFIIISAEYSHLCR